MQRDELQRVRKEIQQEKLNIDEFGNFFRPLEERRKQIEASLPRPEAEVDILEVHNLSAGGIASRASNLYDRWQAMRPEGKREMVEIITDEITINPCYALSSKGRHITFASQKHAAVFLNWIDEVWHRDSFLFESVC